VQDTPQGREYVREVRELAVIARSGKNEDYPLEKSSLPRLFLIVGSRVPMSFAGDRVFEPKTVELRFGP